MGLANMIESSDIASIWKLTWRLRRRCSAVTWCAMNMISGLPPTQTMLGVDAMIIMKVNFAGVSTPSTPSS